MENTKLRKGPKFIKIIITKRMLVAALDSGQYDNHRQVVEREFLLQKDYVVTSHEALRYFAIVDNGNRPNGFIIEGIVGVSVEAR